MNGVWTANSRELSAYRGLKYELLFQSAPATYEQLIQAWRSDEAFRSFFNQLLADVPYASYRWETPSLTTSSVQRVFEFVAIDSPDLAPHPDRHSFAEHFDTAGANDTVVTFANLGRNAILVVPCPVGPDRAYSHLGTFVRAAPAEQQDLLWQRVGEALDGRLSADPVWLSTAGAGVSWLHVRLDNRPKYYRYDPYRVG
ncbi:hypothetical protein NA78x_000709 [Anatilimnocola sp. NA78]|uniref:DUF6940 family protein n=1 Tax=Anatilimnocola sp. NA78 TaxID=3415683 RepID=UPI003CE47F89